MRSLIAEVAVAVMSLPVPVVMKLRTRDLRLGESGRAAPQIHINLSRHRIITLRSDRLAALVAQPAGEFHFPDPALTNELDGVLDRRIGAALRSYLAHPPVLRGRGNQCASFRDVVADGLLDVDVLASLHRPDAAEGVPVVGSCRADDVHRRIAERLSHVADEFRHESLLGGHLFTPVATDLLIRVHQVQQHGSLVSQEPADVIPAPTSQTDDRDAQLAVGVLCASNARSERSGGDRSERTGQEATS